jgi:hypothetical protein
MGAGDQNHWTKHPEWRIALQRNRAPLQQSSSLPDLRQSAYEKSVLKSVSSKPAPKDVLRAKVTKVSYETDVLQMMGKGGSWAQISHEERTISEAGPSNESAGSEGSIGAGPMGLGRSKSGLKRQGRMNLIGAGGGVLSRLAEQREEQMQQLKQEAREEAKQARDAFGRRDWAGSVEHSNAALGKARSEPLLRLRARAKLREGPDKTVLDDAVAALAQAPERADNYRLLGVAQTQAGRLGEAGRSYLQGMQLAPHESTYHGGMGVSTHGGRDNEAAAAAEARFRLPPKRRLRRFESALSGAKTVAVIQQPWRPPQFRGPAPFASYAQLLLAIQRDRSFHMTQFGRKPSKVCDESRAVALAQESSVVNSMSAPERPPQPRCTWREADGLEIAWDDPEDDGGDEIFEWVVECSCAARAARTPGASTRRAAPALPLTRSVCVCVCVCVCVGAGATAASGMATRGTAASSKAGGPTACRARPRPPWASTPRHLPPWTI